MRQTSKRTKKFGIITALLGFMRWICFIIAGILIILIAGQSSGGMLKKIEYVLGPVLWSYILSLVILIVLAIITKDKIKPLVWTANLILSNIIWGSTGLYIMFIASTVDNYIITPLYNTIKIKYIKNKEIDRRL